MDALAEGKHEFVKLLVDNCFNMEMFLKPGKLSELYDKVTWNKQHANLQFILGLSFLLTYN